VFFQNILEMKRHFNFLKKVETTTHPVLLFCFYPLVHHKIEPSLVVIFILIICFLLVKNKTLIKKIKHHWLIIIIPLAIGIISSPDLVEGSRLSLRKISLLLIPVFAGFLSYRKPEELRILFFKLFFLFNIIYVFIHAAFFFIFNDPKYIYYDSNFFRSAIINNPIIGEHPIYVSIFTSISILGGIYLISKTPNIMLKRMLILGFFLKGTFLILIMSKTNLIAMALLSPILIFKLRIFEPKQILVVGLIIGSIFLFLPTQNNRFQDLYRVDFNSKFDTNSSTSLRIFIYKCAYKTLTTTPFFGYGFSQSDSEINKCLISETGHNLKLNTHNQFTDFYLATGVIGLMAFTFWLFNIFKKALLTKDYIFIVVFLMYVFCMLFENVLNRQTGIIFFSFITSFLFNTAENKSETPILKL
jgi:O-antigen ligase